MNRHARPELKPGARHRKEPLGDGRKCGTIAQGNVGWCKAVAVSSNSASDAAYPMLCMAYEVLGTETHGMPPSYDFAFFLMKRASFSA